MCVKVKSVLEFIIDHIGAQVALVMVGVGDTLIWLSILNVI